MVPAIAVATLARPPGPAFAEYEIPEVDAEKGAIEAEYRGASHWGLPPAEETGEGELDALRQSHEIEFQYGVTDWWMLRLTPNVEQVAGDQLELASLGIETQFVLVPRHDGVFGLAFMAGYGPYSFLVADGRPDEFEFGPVMELAPGPWLLTFNPRLVDQLGEFADQEWLGFEYATQARYSVTERWGVAVLMFGEIEELVHSGPFDAQSHVLGPSLYVFSAPDADREWNLGAGVLFGLTDASPDTSLRITFAVEY
ncbi:hypothetical protein AUC69_09625 [Methyloceanibacter superfactus]|uniref:Uncharacterized protein n=1 Tax=Methyloceanibacter superfactus TaxID=1774969 RepID=A0A1E3VXA7_9HYPH|nr:hypothetical protein [Methyloceanibacter superfactus]ODR98174.1 hypothetical protein AUC69_09625 [Methyloceanibacter superfactus]